MDHKQSHYSPESNIVKLLSLDKEKNKKYRQKQSHLVSNSSLPCWLVNGGKTKPRGSTI